MGEGQVPRCVDSSGLLVRSGERRLPSVAPLISKPDFFAGVWAHFADRAKHVVEAGDIDEALRAANVVGDDNLQRRSRGYVVPESFTHGTSEQRVRWFRKGYETGDIRQGDTFNAPTL